jgi:hypothetical protein
MSLRVKILNYLVDVFLCPRPHCLVESNTEPIWTRGCIASHNLDEVMDFLHVRSRIGIPENISILGSLFFFIGLISRMRECRS